MVQVLADRYELIALLAEGDYGRTYLACDRHRPSQPRCVVKELHQYSPKVLKLFQQEATMLERLGNHPQIPALVAHFAVGDHFYIVQDHVEGHDLNREIVPGKKLSEGYARKLLLEVLTVLSFIHHRRVIHRDIKPGNLVRRQRDGQIFLIDFGIVKELSTSEVGQWGRVRTTVVAGTQGYMPPEQGRGKPCLASDLYALGMVAIAALTGTEPHRLPVHPVTGDKVWRDQVTLSQGLGEFTERLVATHPRRRYGSAVVALDQFLALGLGPEQVGVPEPTQVVAPAHRGITSLPIYLPPQMLPWKPVLMGAGVVLVSLVSLGLGMQGMAQWQQWQRSRLIAPGAAPAVAAEQLVCVYADCDRQLRLHREAFEPFWALMAAAEQDGIALYPLAGFQSLAEQEAQWADLSPALRERYRRHADYQTGLVVAFGEESTPGADWQETFGETAAFSWLQARGGEFGFELAFPPNNGPGMPYEPWRWRYRPN